MIDLKDKKNLPIVIGVPVVLIIVVGVVFFLKSRGPEIQPIPATTSSNAAPTAVPSPAGGPPPSPGGDMSAPVPGGAPAPGGPGVPGATTQASAGTGGQQAIATIPPREKSRPDPFSLPGVTGRRQAPPPVPRLDLPPLGRLFPPAKIDPVKHYVDLTPQPVRRVAGILLGDRISALLQTPDGWETVRPGDPLRDGSVVQRIERDRVILRTVGANPRLIEVRLAAATDAPAQQGASSSRNVPSMYRNNFGGDDGSHPM
jgi:hypothetical protein